MFFLLVLLGPNSSEAGGCGGKTVSVGARSLVSILPPIYCVTEGRSHILLGLAYLLCEPTEVDHSGS